MIEVIPLSAHVGAEIRGIDFSREVDAATRDELYAAWLKHLVLVVRDQKLTADDQRRFTSCSAKSSRRVRGPASAIPTIR